MNAAARRALFAALRAANPAPRTELVYGYAVPAAGRGDPVRPGHRLSVNAATAGLFRVAPTPAAMLALGERRAEAAHPHHRPVQHQGEEHPRAPARRCSSSTAARCPATREALEALPGVGRKTANVVLNTAFGEPTIAVDTHIFRVANRTGLAPGKTPRAVEDSWWPPRRRISCATPTTG